MLRWLVLLFITGLLLVAYAWWSGRGLLSWIAILGWLGILVAVVGLAVDWWYPSYQDAVDDLEDDSRLAPLDVSFHRPADEGNLQAMLGLSASPALSASG